MKKTIDLVTFQGLFSEKSFMVPDYQRGYAWETDQITDLLNDLDDLGMLDDFRMQDNLEEQSIRKKHHTGQIVVHKKHEQDSDTVKGVKYDILDIVDEQQRISTLVILISCLLRRLEKLGKTIPEARETAEELTERYLWKGNFRKIHLNKVTDSFFFDHILNPGDNHIIEPRHSSHQNLLNAKIEFERYIKENFSNLDPREEYQKTIKYIHRITNQLEFVYYEVNEEAEAGVLFEVMNSRGKPLTQLEKVKNYLLYTGEKICNKRDLIQLTENINRTWDEIIRSIYDAGDDGSEDSFLRYHWIIYPDQNEKKWLQDGRIDRTYDIHKAVKKTFNLREVSSDFLFDYLEDYLSSLRDSVKAYRDILNPNYTHSFVCDEYFRNNLINTMLSLSRIGRRAVVLPLLMAAYQRYFKQPEQLLQLFKYSETFIFRLTLLEKYASTGRSSLYWLASEILSKKLNNLEVIEKLRSSCKEYCDDNKLRSAFENMGRNFYSWGGLRYFLYEYERFLVINEKQNFDIDWRIFYQKRKEKTIEHILPQGDNTLEEEYWNMRFSNEEWSQLKDSIGNLCLTDWNQHYGNKGFDRKVGSIDSPDDEKVYRNSRWLQESRLKRFTDWTKDEILQRRDELIKFALERWQI